MAWAWVRPADPDVLDGRPLLDLGTGDAQTLTALVRRGGLVVGLDRSEIALRAARQARGVRLVAASADSLPAGPSTFRTSLAADLFHHLDDEALGRVLSEARRVLKKDGRLVAWWYERSARPGPEAPRHPRAFEDVAAAMDRAGFDGIERLELEFGLEPAPATVGARGTA